MSVYLILGLLILLLGGGYAVVAAGHRTHTLLPALTSFFLHLSLSILIFIEEGLFSPDALYYDTVARQIATNSDTDLITEGKEGWPILLSFLYRIFDYSPSLGLILNSVAAALTVTVLASAARRLDLPPRTTAWIAALHPVTLLWSSLLLRESLVWLFLSMAFLGFSGFASNRPQTRQIAILAVALVGLLTLRGTVAILFLGAGIAALLLSRKSGKTIVAVAALLTIGSLVGPIAGRVDAIAGIYTADSLTASRTALGRGGTTAFITSGTDLGSLQTALPKVMPRVLFGPFPWEWPAVGLPFFVDAVLWCALLFYAFRGWLRHRDKRQLWIIWLPATAILVSLAMTSGNYGTMVRLRSQATILIIPLAASGFSRRGRAESRQDLSREVSRVKVNSPNEPLHDTSREQ